MAVVYPDGGYPVYYWPTYVWPVVGAVTYSIREQVLNAVKAALEASTGINYVTLSKDAWWDWPGNRYPGVIIMTGDEVDSRFCFSADADMDSKMRIRILGYVFDKNNNLGSKRSDLIGAIETAVSNDATVTGLVSDIVMDKVQTDKGELDNFSVVDCEFGLDYLYSRANP